MNKLSGSASPYLLQHANNPVNWYPWGNEALQKARDENKLIIVSIGYSACHWCHVMEHESFEDEQVAAVMNEYFVCIKVDREERPDVDQIYMSAIQLTSGRGGWPLNCICLPDQRPIYAGTYFRKNDWTSLLFQLADFYSQKPEEAEEYANRLTQGIQQFEAVDVVKDQPEYTKDDLRLIIKNWKRYFDMTEGGFGAAPKFPMPNSWQCLMRYGYLAKDQLVTDAVKLTLKKMAFGGIYDHIGGGFARYSVDGLWHVPHFEKMLYDNAQLISLYSEAYVWNPDPLYKVIVEETISFCVRELYSPEHGYYSALDADSEGVEGKFYIFSKAEIEHILGEDAGLFCAYYHITAAGNWEEERTNVLFRRESDEEVAAGFGLAVAELVEKIGSLKEKVFNERAKRIRPGLDNKLLASWNGLMLKGLCDAYRAFNEPRYLELALANAGFIGTSLIKQDGRLSRIFNNQLFTAAFLDDYANILSAFIALYEVTFDEQWIIRGKQLAEIAIAHYFDEAAGVFYYTANDEEQLIARKSEIMDGVTPASNSVMAYALKKLGLFFANETYTDISSRLLRNIVPHLGNYGASYSNWIMLLTEEVFGTYEVAITGDDFEGMRLNVEQQYIPNKIILGGISGSLPLLEGRFAAETRIFVCRDKTCGLPVNTVDDMLKQIDNQR